MKKHLKMLMFGKYSALIFAVLSAICILLSYSFRFSYVFLDNALFDNFAFTLLITEILSCAFLIVCASMTLKKSSIANKKPFRVMQCICRIFSILFAVIVIVTIIISGGQSRSVGIKLLKEAFPFWVTIISVCFIAFIVPYFESQKLKKAISVVTAIVISAAVYSAFFPVSPYKFTSGTAVFDNGKDYAVVFSTNDKGTAYIEYEYEGEIVRIFDENNGRKNGSRRIHTIHVPYEQLMGNTYKVFSTRVIDELSYGGRLGKTIESESIKFNNNPGGDVTALAVSDWHSYNETAKKAISYLGDYNAVLLLGDSAPGLMVPEETEDYIVKFASDISRGTMPVIFARGNHETRGKDASNLASYLGMDKFYFTTELGDYKFIVLDSGEDKKDDHIEYGGMVLYEQNRKKMVNWLRDVEPIENEKIIAVSHSDEICIEEDLSKAAHDKLNELNVSLLVSGHCHKNEFKQNLPYPTLIDGGIDAVGKGTYVASKLTITEDKIDITSVDSNGKTTISETVNWR